MEAKDWVPALIAALLGGGGVAFLSTIVKGWQTLRTGARAGEREATADLKTWNVELDERARRAERDGDYWHRVAAGYAWQLRLAGVEPVPAEPVPPSERTP